MVRLFILVLALLASPALADRQEVALGGRAYLIELPDRAAGAPVILALHGGGGNPAQFARSSGLARAATAAGFAVVFPAGTGRTRLLTWNGGYCCGFAARAGVDDIAFLDAVVADATQRFGVDGGRLYLTGMSNGSLMAEAYAAARPARVKAVAGVAGTLDLARFPMRGPVPLLHIHGTADAQVPFAGGQGREGYTDTVFTPVAAVVAAFARANGATRQDQVVIDPARDGTRVIRSDHIAGGRVVVRLLAIEGGGHVWPGGRRAARQGGATRDIEANAELLRFFAMHP